MLDASSLTLRMTTSVSQNAPAFAAKLNSIARRVPSDLTLYPLPCAAWRATLSHMLSTNPYNNELGESRQEWLSTNGGRSFRCGHQLRRRPPDESGDTSRAKSSVFWPSSAQMTRVRLTPARDWRLRRASRKVQAVELPFFEPRGDGLPGDAEGARKSPQTAALVVSAKYLFACLFWISIAARLLAAALAAVTAEVTLAAIGSQAVTHQSFALAMLTS